MTDTLDLSQAIYHSKNPYLQRDLSYFMTDDRVCCENIAAAMFVTVKEMRAGPS